MLYYYVKWNITEPWNGVNDMKEIFKKKTDESGAGSAPLGGTTWYGVDKLLFVRIGIAAVLLCLGLFLQLGDGITLLLLLLSTLISGFDVLYQACVRLVREHRLGEELLVSIAAILAFTINEGYEAAAVMLIYQAGCIVRAYASALTKSSFRDHVDPYVASVTVLRGEEKTSIPPENVQLGDILILERGQRAPADLEILEGSVTLDLAPIFGHTARREVTAGQKIPPPIPFSPARSTPFPIRRLSMAPRPIRWNAMREFTPRSLSV